MSLETQIRQAFERHATDPRPRPQAWDEVGVRIARRNRRRALAGAVGAAAVVTAAAVAGPRLLAADPTPPVTPIQSVVPTPLEVLPSPAPTNPQDPSSNATSSELPPALQALVNQVTHDQAKRMDGDHPAQFDKVIRGDLDGDQDSDAALLYTIEGFAKTFDGQPSEGGQGSSSYVQILAALLMDGPEWSLSTQEQVGGKSIRSVSLNEITDGFIVLGTLGYAQGDPACCPSVKGMTRYRLEGGQLTEI